MELVPSHGPHKEAESDSVRLTPEYALHALRKMLVLQTVYGLPGTDGTLRSNVIARLHEEHMVASIWFGNRSSKFTRLNRLMLLFNSCSFILFFTTFFISKCPNYCNKNTQRSTLFGFIVSVMLFFYKKIFRYALECGCYANTHFVQPAEDAFKSSKSGKHSVKAKHIDEEPWILWVFGHMLSLVCFVFAVLWILGGIKTAFEINKGSPNYVVSFVFSLGFSFCGTSVVFDGAWTYLRLEAHKKAFREHFSKYVPDLKCVDRHVRAPVPAAEVGTEEVAATLDDDILVSISQIGDRAKSNWIAANPLGDFKETYPDYDEYFLIGDFAKKNEIETSKKATPP
jgi:hypothetical protein